MLVHALGGICTATHLEVFGELRQRPAFAQKEFNLTEQERVPSIASSCAPPLTDESDEVRTSATERLPSDTYRDRSEEKLVEE